MFDHCLYFNTTSLARLLEREWAQAFLPFELSPPQAFLLRAILDRPGTAPKDLATTLVIARPTATRALDGLQAKGLIERSQTSDDGRETAIHPTARAIAIHAALNAASGRVTRRMKDLLGEKTFADTVDRVRRVRSAIA